MGRWKLMVAGALLGLLVACGQQAAPVVMVTGINGTVLDVDGRPAGDAVVTFYRADLEVSGSLLTTEGALAAQSLAFQTTTSANGAYHYQDASPGRYTVYLTKGDRAALIRDVVVKAGLKVVLSGVRLGQAGAIAGTVTLVDGGDPEGAAVFLPGTGFMAFAAADGHFRIDSVPASPTGNPYRIVAMLGGYVNAADTVDVRKHVTSTVDLTLERPAAAPPTITALSPDPAAPLGVLTIRGSRFGALRDTSTVTIGGLPVAAYLGWSDAAIEVRVPLGVPSGAAVVVVNVGGVPVSASITIQRFTTFGGALLLAHAAAPVDIYDREFVAIDGDQALVPSLRDAAGNTLEGSVQAYQRQSDGSWAPTATLTPPLGFDGARNFGKAVELRGSTAAILSEHPVPGTASYESDIHIFERDGSGAWSQRAVLLRGQGIGLRLAEWHADISMALGDGVLAVGVPDGYASSVRVFERNFGGADAWGQAAVIPLPPNMADTFCCWFGADIAVSDDGQRIAVANSLQNNDGGLGVFESVYVYQRHADDPTRWDLEDEVTSAELPSTLSTYVAIDGDTLAVTHLPSIHSDTAEVSFYERGVGGPGNWGEIATHHLQLPTPAGLYPSAAVTSLRIQQNTAIVGMTWSGCVESGPPVSDSCGSGEVHVFGRNVGGADAWGEAQVLHADPAYPYQMFGAAVDISSDGRTIAVGTNPQDPTTSGGSLGEVYLFSR